MFGETNNPTMANPHNIKKDQTVWVQRKDYLNKPEPPYEAIVKSVGRKYLEAQRVFDEATQYAYPVKFDLETLREATESNYKDRLWLSIEDYQREVEFNRLSEKVRIGFSIYGVQKLSLEKLRQISEILDS
jgi:hypothetical protein